MFGRKTLDRVEHMLDEAITGNFRESDYDETHLSKLESKWKQYLGMSVLTRENMEKEKENVKSLVSDISHQTKTPIANMKVYLEILKEEPLSDQGKAFLGNLESQADKLDFLFQNMVKMSRLETGIIRIQKETGERT